ncbi:hypothetical protein GGS23DRAFT_547340 [Durotheca rogersii]|uniref:uncharacterized protein n=1 Tax=Durotheca rogersii TaxID=419775 RepID=UPI00222058F0|nr:uncharacterized protein GGS23DRAFT_547340 [Durotheca rogersii]KAI5867212.1 hypothetical protein GGS23DRAFT_547340 [Durotheca rogersii]
MSELARTTSAIPLVLRFLLCAIGQASRRFSFIINVYIYCCYTSLLYSFCHHGAALVPPTLFPARQYATRDFVWPSI